MKIIYDDKQERYIIKLEEYEGVYIANTKDIVEARNYFVENMKILFNNAICEQLKNNDCVGGTIAAHSICCEDGKLYAKD